MSFVTSNHSIELPPKLDDSSYLNKNSTDSLSNIMHQWILPQRILPQISTLIRLFELLPQSVTPMLRGNQNQLEDLLGEMKQNQIIPNPFALLAWSKLMRSCLSDRSNSVLPGQFDLETNQASNDLIKVCGHDDMVLDLTQKSNSVSNPMETATRCQEIPKWLFDIGKDPLIQTCHLSGSNGLTDQASFGCNPNFINPCLCNNKGLQIRFSPEPEPTEYQYANSTSSLSDLMNNALLTSHCDGFNTNNPSLNDTYSAVGQDGWRDKYNSLWDNQNDIPCFPLPKSSIEAFNINQHSCHNNHLNKDSSTLKPYSQDKLSIAPQSTLEPIAGPPPSFSPPLNFGAFTMDQNMICPICRKCFRFEKNLLRHLQKTHATGTGESVLKCKLCNYTTRHYSNMYVHIRTHTGDKPYSCSACGVSFTQGSSLKLHIKSRHNDNGNYFSLTRKPGKNNLTKLWTRVLKKDLPKFTSMKNNQLTMNLASSNEWQMGTTMPNSMTMMMTMMMRQPTRISNLRHSFNLMTNSTDLSDSSYRISSSGTKFSLDSSLPGENGYSDQRKNGISQIAPSSSSSSSPSSCPSFVILEANKQRKFLLEETKTLTNSISHRATFPWKHLNQTKKLDRTLMKCQRLTSDVHDLSRNDSFKQDLQTHMSPHCYDDQGHEKQQEGGDISIKQEYYNTSDSELFPKPFEETICDSMNVHENSLPNLKSDPNENTNHTEVNMNSEKLLPFSIAAIQPR